MEIPALRVSSSSFLSTSVKRQAKEIFSDSRLRDRGTLLRHCLLQYRGRPPILPAGLVIPVDDGIAALIMYSLPILLIEVPSQVPHVGFYRLPIGDHHA